MKLQLNIKKYLPYLLLGSMCFLVAFISFNQEVFAVTKEVGGNKAEIDSLNTKILSKKEKVKQLEKSIADYKNKIEIKQKESVSLSNQVGILDNRIVQVELDIQATEEKIETLELEVQSLELNIEDKEVTISRQQDMIGELLRTIQYNDNKKYIEVVANYDSFSEFYNSVQYVKTVEKNVGANARTLRLVKEELEEKKNEKEERKASYDELKEELEEKKKTLDEQVFAKENLLAQTKYSELTFKTLLQQLKSQYQQIENEISGIEREIRRKLESEDKLDELSNGESLILSWPTQSRYITARFRDPSYPYRHVFEHSAIDIRSAQGTPVKASASGYVARARFCKVSTCYAYVLLVHADGVSTLYGHLNQIHVQEGDFVARGDQIGNSGAAPGTIGAGPFTTGPHLHFEVRNNGIPTNPLGYLIKDY